MDNSSESPTTPPPATPPPPPIQPPIQPPIPTNYTPPPPSLIKTAPPIPPVIQAGDPKLKIRVSNEVADADACDNDLTAPFNTRVIAAVIDCVLALGLIIATSFILPSFLGSKIPCLVGLAYLVIRDSLPLLGGQSVGKKAMSIKVVTLNDKSLVSNWEPSLIRNCVLIIPLFALVELFILISREDKPGHGRRLGDEWAKTKVIIAKDPATEAEKNIASVPGPEQDT